MKLEDEQYQNIFQKTENKANIVAINESIKKLFSTKNVAVGNRKQSAVSPTVCQNKQQIIEQKLTNTFGNIFWKRRSLT